jgi:phage-related minor tail protein
MTTPSGGTEIGLILGVDASSGEAAIPIIEKIGTASINSSKSMDTLSDAAKKNADWMSQATTKYENQIQAMQRQWKAEQDALIVEKEMEKARQAAIESGTKLIAKLNETVNAYGKTREELLRMKAAQLGVADSAEPLIKKLEEMRMSQERLEIQQKRDVEMYKIRAKEAALAAAAEASALKKVHGGAHETSTAMELLSNTFSTARAKTEALVLAHEALQGRFSRMPGSLMVLAEYSGLASLAFTGMSVGILGVVTAVGLLSYGLIAGQAEQKHMNDALILTGNYSGQTTSSLRELAKQAAATGGTIGDAKEVVLKLAESGRFTGEQLSIASKAIVEMEHATGKSADGMIKQFETLTVQAGGRMNRFSDGITTNLLKLNDQYHFLTVEVYKQIRAMELHGDQIGASTLAIKTLADAEEKRAHEITSNLGSIERGWNAVKNAISGARDALLSIGRAQTDAEQILKLKTEIQAIESRQTRGAYAPGQDDEKRITDAKNLIVFKSQLQTLTAKEKSDAEAAKKASEEQQKTEQALYDLRHKDHETGRNKDDGRKQDLLAELEHQQAVYKLTEEATNSNEKLLKDSYKARIIDNDTYYAMLKQGREDELLQLTETTNKKISILEKYNAKDKRDTQETLRRIQQVKDEKIAAEQKIADAIAKSESEAATLGSGKINGLAAKTEFDAKKITEAGDALESYGKHAQQTAMQVAELQIANERQIATVSESAATSLRQAAAFKDMATSYRDIEKFTTDLAEKEQTISANNLENVLGAEGAKVAAWKQSSEAYVELEFQKAQAAINFARAASPSGIADPQQEMAFYKAQEAHAKAIKAINQVGAKKFEIAGLKDTANEFDKMAKSLSKLGDHFTNAVKGMKGLHDAFDSLAKAQDAQNKGEAFAAGDKIAAYGDMADAASNFFEKQSTGYRAMQSISQAFHIAQVAMNLVEMGQMAIKAVLNQANGDPYTAWARMAAMAAAVAVLGFAVGGGFQHESDDNSAANIQRAQGTGTVLGDAQAKSESITKAMESLKKNSDLTMPISLGMLAALRNIEVSMGGLAQIVFRTLGITGGDSLGYGSSSTFLNGGNKAQAMTDKVDKYLAKYDMGSAITIPLTNLATRIVQNIMGKSSSSVTDSGLGVSGSLGDVSEGKGIYQYANIHTVTKKLFGLISDSSDAMVTGEVDKTVSDQVGKVFKGISDTILLASSTFVTDTTGIKAKLDEYVVNIPKISLRGLSGQALQDALNAVFSAFSDTLAHSILPGMEEFQKVGEGYFETLIRIVNGVESANNVLEKFGIEAIKYSDIVNKQGDVAVEIARQSIIAFETSSNGIQSGVAKIVDAFDGSISDLSTMYQTLIDLRKLLYSTGLNGNDLSASMIQGAGGAQQLQSGLSAYLDKFFTPQEKAAAEVKDVQDSFAKLGLEMPTSLAAFRALVTSIGTSTDANAKLTGSILALADPFSTAITDATSGLNDLTSSLSDFKNSLLAQLNMSPNSTAASTKAQLDRAYSLALSGDSNSQTNFQGYAQAYLDAAKAGSSTAVEYQRNVASVLRMTDSVIAAMNQQSSLLLRGPGQTVGSPNDFIDGIHASGADYIPKDGWRASLHKGEMVLPSHIAQNVRANNGNSDTSELVAVVKDLNRAVLRGNEHLKKTSDLLVRVTRDGNSLVTVPA